MSQKIGLFATKLVLISPLKATLLRDKLLVRIYYTWHISLHKTIKYSHIFLLSNNAHFKNETFLYVSKYNLLINIQTKSCNVRNNKNEFLFSHLLIIHLYKKRYFFYGFIYIIEMSQTKCNLKQKNSR